MATREMVAKYGYDGTVMSHVAGKAGVSPTTLYNLYNTKDELVLAAIREDLIRNIQQLAERTGGPGWDYLLQWFKGGAGIVKLAPEYAEAVTRAFLRASPGDVLVEMLLITARKNIRRSLKAMKERGELRTGVDIDKLATNLMGVYWSTFMLRSKGLLDVSQLEQALEMNLVTILASVTRGKVRGKLNYILGGMLDK